ncbi:hypothetical protein CALVIDRAFT_568500 [Calocera viscosa TUFC12733]|uniref:Uncharacterized protein n=1 Tax=Calocera viscosa (strain TUFC12733) TaxID=1330018 RepID=A0A167H1Q6_CALVF|nr:hypothetical protein CALVIDRAFT_568500 [Calocera viscosa TUFC12733]
MPTIPRKETPSGPKEYLDWQQRLYVSQTPTPTPSTGGDPNEPSPADDRSPTMEPPDPTPPRVPKRPADDVQRDVRPSKKPKVEIVDDIEILDNRGASKSPPQDVKEEPDLPPLNVRYRDLAEARHIENLIRGFCILELGDVAETAEERVQALEARVTELEQENATLRALLEAQGNYV